MRNGYALSQFGQGLRVFQTRLRFLQGFNHLLQLLDSFACQIHLHLELMNHALFDRPHARPQPVRFPCNSFMRHLEFAKIPAQVADRGSMGFRLA